MSPLNRSHAFALLAVTAAALALFALDSRPALGHGRVTALPSAGPEAAAAPAAPADDSRVAAGEADKAKAKKGAKPDAKGPKGEAKVSAMDGKGKAFKGKRRKSPPAGDVLKVGAVVAEDDYIMTQADSRVELELADGTRFRIGENSVIKIKKLLFDAGGRKRDFDMKVEGGRVWVAVRKATGFAREDGKTDDQVRVGTNIATAGVRGTIFRVRADDDATVLSVVSGAVSFRGEGVAKGGPAEAPAGDPGRREVQGPREVTRGEFEAIVARMLEEVTIDTTGRIQRREFGSLDEMDKARPEEAVWLAWNHTRDEETREQLETPLE